MASLKTSKIVALALQRLGSLLPRFISHMYFYNYYIMFNSKFAPTIQIIDWSSSNNTLCVFSFHSLQKKKNGQPVLNMNEKLSFKYLIHTIMQITAKMAISCTIFLTADTQIHQLTDMMWMVSRQKIHLNIWLFSFTFNRNSCLYDSLTYCFTVLWVKIECVH